MENDVKDLIIDDLESVLDLCVSNPIIQEFPILRNLLSVANFVKIIPNALFLKKLEKNP